MRLSRALLKRRVNAPAAFRFERSGLTSCSGLELVRIYGRGIGLTRRLRDGLHRRLPKTDYGVVPMVLLLLALILTGGRRLRHLRNLSHDPVVARFCGLSQIPNERSVGRWLSRFDGVHVDALLKFNEEMAAEMIHRLGLSRLTLDVDGSVVSTGLKVDGACRGYNPHRRKVPSYYPITAYEAQSGQLLRVENRPGNVHDGKGALAFVQALIDQVRCDVPEVKRLEFRMDGAFFLKEIIGLLDQPDIEYTIKVPFWRWLDLQSAIRVQSRWQRVDERVECFEHVVDADPWQRRERVVIYRKRVFHRTRKNFQLDLFDPDNGTYEYSAIATNKTLSGPRLWQFMCGRGAHEKVYGELKSGFAFATVPSQRYAANSAWQVLSVLAFNLMRGLQTTIQDPVRGITAKRTTRFRFQSIHTLRFEWLNRAGVLVAPHGKTTLDVGPANPVRERFQSIGDALLRAA